MFGKFLPKETNFFDLFEKHIAIVVQSAKELLSLVTTEANISTKAKHISHLEKEADIVTHQCKEALHKTFITPIEREDIFRLISRMDDIVDDLEGASACICLYKLNEMNSTVKDLADVLLRAVLEVEIALKELRNLKHAEHIRTICVNIHRLENEADDILMNGVVKLFDEVEDARIIMKWKEIYELLELGTDHCEDVANIIEGVILEHA